MNYLLESVILRGHNSSTAIMLAEMKAAADPFVLGPFSLYLSDEILWHDSQHLVIEFERHPWLNFTYTFSKQDKLYAGDTERLAYDFGRAWADFFRHYRVELDPDTQIELGEN